MASPAMRRHADGAARATPQGARGNAMTIEAFLFDVFGTCVDWREGIAREVAKAASEKGLPIDSFAFADAWRGRYQPAMEEIRSGRRDYVELDVVHRENLDATLDAFGL